MRPLLIVDNNLDDFNAGKAEFTQNILLDMEVIEKLRKGLIRHLIN